MMEKAFKELMTKRHTINFFLFISVAFSLFIIFRPRLWQDKIESYLNNQLMDKGWSIDISELSGHLLYNLYSDNVELNHENGSSILFPKANADIEIIPLLSAVSYTHLTLPTNREV